MPGAREKIIVYITHFLVVERSYSDIHLCTFAFAFCLLLLAGHRPCLLAVAKSKGSKEKVRPFCLCVFCLCVAKSKAKVLQ
jgi:hypothetical protein